VAAGRFDSDGDGLYEVAVANYGSGTVTILEGHRDGTFTIIQEIAVEIAPVSLATSYDKGDGTTTWWWRTACRPASPSWKGWATARSCSSIP